MVSIFKHWRTTYERIDKFLSDIYFTDVNLYGKLISDSDVLSEVLHFNEVTQPVESSKDNFHLRDDSSFSFDEVINKSLDNWTVVDTATFSFGPTWSIHWFRLNFSIPHRWLQLKNTCIELHWNSGSEVLVYSSTGAIVTGLNSIHSRISVPVSCLAPLSEGGEAYSVYLQVSCSDLFGSGDGGMIRPPTTDKIFKIEKAKLALLSTVAITVARDLKILMQIAENLKETDRGHQALYVANDAVNTIVDIGEDDLGKKLTRAQTTIDKFFQSRNGLSQVTLHVMGHCHIDTAWLWRYGESRRKTARSWSTTLRLLESHPNMTFVCSQAQQLAWLKEDYPILFGQLQEMSAKKQFIAVGGTWVEMDVNLPCCESLCRQFLYGQRFFKANFGAHCKEFWLPDTFGYSPQLPQIMHEANIGRFMTQKMSWSLVNKFPNHTFWWRGIDGSRVLTHFPPGDSYSMSAKVSEILHSVTNFSDKGRSSSMMYLYGHGDGGQGPTEEMVYTLDRLQDCDGLPKIVNSSPDLFFSLLEERDGRNLCTWSGELFLELHNGTYTTQRQIKKGNVHSEQLLRAVEFLVCLAQCDSSRDSGDGHDNCVRTIREDLESKWKILLLNQFHDVLPGSSIEHVCDDAYWAFDSLIQWCSTSIRTLGSILTNCPHFTVNPTSWPLVVPIPQGDITESSRNHQSIPSYSIVAGYGSRMTFPDVEYLYDHVNGQHKVSNQFIEIVVDDRCRITSLKMNSSPELGNVLLAPANELFLFDDVPLYWDAWDVMDYHLETGVALSSVASFRLMEGVVITSDGCCATLKCQMVLNNTGTTIEKSVSIHSHLDYVTMHTKVIKWNESHRMMKIRVPTIATSTEVHYRTQAGVISRPSHRNTSWDAAKYEVCSHEWIQVGDANWGVALFKDAIFGSSAMGGDLYLSLLRSPTAPDKTADKKYLPHLFSYAIYPFCADSGGNKFATITQKASQFCWLSTFEETFTDFVGNCGQPSPVTRSFPLRLVSPMSGEVSLDWIKPSCDDRGHFIVRVHEQIGGRYLVRLASDLPIKEAFVTNILEERIPSKQSTLKVSLAAIEFDISPFKIVSIDVEFGQ